MAMFSSVIFLFTLVSWGITFHGEDVACLVLSRRQVVGNYLIRRFYKASPDAGACEDGCLVTSGTVTGVKIPCKYAVNEVGWLELSRKKSVN